MPHQPGHITILSPTFPSYGTGLTEGTADVQPGVSPLPREPAPSGREQVKQIGISILQDVAAWVRGRLEPEPVAGVEPTPSRDPREVISGFVEGTRRRVEATGLSPQALAILAALAVVVLVSVARSR